MIKRLLGWEFGILGPDGGAGGAPKVDLPDDIVLPEDLEDEIEYVIGGDEVPPVAQKTDEDDEGIPEHLKGMTKSQLAALAMQAFAKQGQVSNDDMLSQVQRLLAQQGQVQPANRNAKSEEETAKEFNDKIVNSDNPYAAVKALTSQMIGEAVSRVGSYMGPMQLMVLKGNSKYPYFEKYADEVGKLFGTLTPEQQTQTGAADWAYNTVVASHVGDLIKEAEGKKSAAKADTFSTMPVGNNQVKSGPAAPKRRVVLTPSKMDEMIARQTGQPVEVVTKARYRRENRF